MTSASTSTKGFPTPAPPAPTLTNATSLDALQPTQERTTLTPQALHPHSQRLAAQAIPPEAAIEYLSKLSPTTPIGLQGPRVSKEYPNFISARQNPHIVSNNLLKELQLGHTAGSFVSPPFPNFQVYPIGVVPKKHSTERRTIFHLSFPKHQTTSVNSHISPTDYSLHYITIDTAISIIQNIGQGCFMSKLDVKSAFRNIPVHPSDWELLGMKLNGLYFFDTVLPFGLRSAPYLFDQFSCMIEWIIKNKLGIPNVIHILDEFFFVTRPPRSDCLTALCKILFFSVNSISLLPSVKLLLPPPR